MCALGSSLNCVMSFIPKTCCHHHQRSGRSKSDLEVDFWPIYILTSGKSKSGDKELTRKNFRMLPTQTFQLNSLKIPMTWLSFMPLHMDMDALEASKSILLRQNTPLPSFRC